MKFQIQISKAYNSTPKSKARGAREVDRRA